MQHESHCKMSALNLTMPCGSVSGELNKHVLFVVKSFLTVLTLKVSI